MSRSRMVYVRLPCSHVMNRMSLMVCHVNTVNQPLFMKHMSPTAKKCAGEREIAVTMRRGQ